MKKFRLLGIDDNESTCEICGRIELKRVMWIVELDSDGSPIGNAIHCGTTCGARMMGRKISQVNRTVDNFEETIQIERNKIFRKIDNDLNDWIIKKWNAEGLHFRERRNSPEWAQLIANQKIARKIADNTEIIIEL